MYSFISSGNASCLRPVVPFLPKIETDYLIECCYCGMLLGMSPNPNVIDLCVECYDDPSNVPMAHMEKLQDESLTQFQLYD